MGKKQSEQQKKVQVEIQRARDWIDKIEARANELLEYNVSEMTADGREAAISKHLMTLGRFMELVRNLEIQLEGGEDSEDSPQNVHNLTFGEATPHNS